MRPLHGGYIGALSLTGHFDDGKCLDPFPHQKQRLYPHVQLTTDTKDLLAPRDHLPSFCCVLKPEC